jgi:catechol 2,3-dioxygenase-like lactoylglutathione lyase family enzyme
MTATHGTILGGLVTTPDLNAALTDYQGRLGLTLVERATLSADLAASWGCSASAGAAMATLQPTSGAPCHLRLIEQPTPADFRPTRTYGWAAYEFSVQDVYGWPHKLAGSGFEIVGPPKEIAGLPYFVPMQVTGRGREMLYLNEVRENTPSSDLPKATSPVDKIFIVILATPDIAGTVAWYKSQLALDEGGTYTIEYTMLNKAFALPDGTQHTLTMVQAGRLPIAEVDHYPAEATARAHPPGTLPPGNALVTLGVRSLDTLSLDWITPPTPRDGPLYAGRRAATTRGPAGELLELVEIG